MKYRIDVKKIRDAQITLEGWVLGEGTQSFSITSNKEHIPFEIVRVKRDDVAQKYYNRNDSQNLGFILNFPYEEEKEYEFEICADGKKVKNILSAKQIRYEQTIEYKQKSAIKKIFDLKNIKAGISSLLENGLTVTFKKAKSKLKGEDCDFEYQEWKSKTDITENELEAQRKLVFNKTAKFYLTIPVYDTPDKFLIKLLDSIFKQTYKNYFVVIVDATEYSKAKNNPRKILEAYKKYENLKVLELDENKGISENTNVAISYAQKFALKENNSFIVLVDHDDELSLEALYRLNEAYNLHPLAKVLYSDEDKVDMEDSFYFEPNFKPDFSMAMLESVNYFCHLTAIDSRLLEEIKINDSYERKDFDGAQDYDLFLRVCEKALEEEEKYFDNIKICERIEKRVCTKERKALCKNMCGNISKLKNNIPIDEISKEDLDNLDIKKKILYKISQGLYTSEFIVHIPRALYHWRCHKASTADNPEAKLYAFKAGEEALREHFHRIKVPIKNVEKGFNYGLYHISYDLEEELISIIIPNKDHIDDLDKAIRSVLQGNYKNLEFIICENNSTEEKTFSYYDSIQKEFGDKVRVCYWKDVFNFSGINNFAVKEARGEILLFLNNDVEMLAANSIKEMFGCIKRRGVGAVGAKLLYSDETIQHAGVVIGFGGIAGHTFIGAYDKDNTYMQRAQITQNYSAATAACLMVRRDVFEEIGGFDENLQVAFNDIDLCMKIRATGETIIYNPYACFFHFESKSRGYEDTKEKVERFNSEMIKFAKKWKLILKNGDPYYNPNLSLRKSNFALRNLSVEEIGEPYYVDILKDIVDYSNSNAITNK